MRRLFSLSLVALMGLSAASHAEVRVLTSIKPLQLIASAIQGEGQTPQVLLPAGASAHHYALRPSDMRRLDEAQLIYWIGPNLETFLTPVLKAHSSKAVTIQELSGLKLQHFGSAAEEEHEHHAEHEEDGDADHQPGALDSHLWLSIHNAQIIAQRMAADLSALDPQQAAVYANNLQTFEARLQQLQTDLKHRLAPLAQKSFFVFHEAYNYFEADYGLKHRAAFHLSEENQPGAKHIAALREELKNAGPSCIFSEPPARPRLAQNLTQDLPVHLAELDPLGAHISVGTRGYEQLLTQMAQGFSQCLQNLPTAP